MRVHHVRHVLPADRQQTAYNLVHVLRQVPERLTVAVVLAVLAAAAADHSSQVADAPGSQDDEVLVVLVHQASFALILQPSELLAEDADGLVYPATTVATRVCRPALLAGCHSACLLYTSPSPRD